VERAPARTKIERIGERDARDALRTLGWDIRHAREDRAISQTRLAGAAGISQGLLSMVESGRVEPSVTTLGRVPCYSPLKS
jgi:DNA-binding XRE family transcriptional regulator